MFLVWQNTIVNEHGDIQPGAFVEIKYQESGVNVQLYADSDGTTPVNNPVQADDQGFVRVYVRNEGRTLYRIRAFRNGFDRVWENELIGIGEPRTQAEISSGVIPVDYAYEPGYLPRYNNDWADAFAVSSAGKIKVRVPGGSYEIDSEIEHTGDVDIELLGPVTITCTAASTISSIFKITGKLRISGARLTINGDDKTYLAIHCPTVLPELENITFQNTLSVAMLAGRNFDGLSATGYSGANGTGHGYMKHCRGENCGSFALPTGNGSTSDTSFGLIDCSTDDECGDVTNVFNLAELGYGYVRGGWYQGASTTAPNMTRTGRCEYIGGRYENMTRGPTVGEGSDQVTIVGGISKGMSFSGVSIDARLSDDDSVPYVTGKVDWTVHGPTQWGIFCQASGVELNCRYIGDGTETSANSVVRLTDALNVSIGRVTAYNAGGGLLVSLGSGNAPMPGSSAYKTGDWVSDTTSVTPVRASAESTIHMSRRRVVTESADISYLDDIIEVDASGGVIDLDFPGVSAAADVRGKTWTIIVVDSTNAITITRDGGGATAINGGANFTIRAGSGYRELRVHSTASGNYLVTAPVVSGAPEFTVANETEDRSFDANSTTVEELADVVATLISDLQRG